MESADWTWHSVVKALGGPKAVGLALGESKSTVSGWAARPGGIPGKHWSDIVKLAVEVGKPEINLEVLAGVARRHAGVLEEARA